EAGWDSPPFEPSTRGSRLYGRGSSDDKSGIVTHLGALRVFGGQPPVGLKLIIEGEEEIGSPHLAGFLAAHRELLAADVIVVADSEHWRIGQPALTTSLRGLIDCTVEVRVLEAGVHSGQLGGPVPDALSTLSRLLATLHHDDGSPAVAGLVASESPPLDLDEAELRAQAGLLPGVQVLGSGHLTSRLWTQPAISVLGIDAPAVAESINQLLPVARAKVSVRLAPGDEPARAMEALVAHLQARAPWGARVTVDPGASAAPFRLDANGPAYDAFRGGMRAAWGQAPLEIGIGGSIPFVAEFAATFPAASIVLTGVGEPSSRIHGPNESQDLEELERNVAAEAIALDLLGEQPPST
ncbi:MAG: M20/M25/M40 family metallo-hydrolase, partial [Chloroflexi bacterium]|nr:M20/M25/M40 family metallo-hydrolase [Chloroflexota bacterium]